MYVITNHLRVMGYFRGYIVSNFGQDGFALLTADRILEGLVALESARSQQKKNKGSLKKLASSLAADEVDAEVGQKDTESVDVDVAEPKGRGRGGRGRGKRGSKNKIRAD